MPSCPVCENDLEFDDFGLVDCKSCGALCSVGLDGEVKVQSQDEQDASVQSTEQEAGYDLENHEDDLNLNEDTDDYYDEVGEDQDQDQDIETEEDFEDIENFDVEDSPETENYVFDNDDANSDGDEFDSSETEMELDDGRVEGFDGSSDEEDDTPTQPMDPAEFLESLDVFSSSSLSNESDHVYYDLIIEGLNSNEKKSLLVEYLSSERLNLPEDYVRSLLNESSQVLVPQLNFLRLSLAYKAVLPLSLDLDWKKSEIQAELEDQIENNDDELEFDDGGSEDDEGYGEETDYGV